MVAELRFVLAAGCYDAATAARADLRDLTNPGPTCEVMAGTALLHHEPEHARLEHLRGGTTAFWAGTGGAVGVLAGILVGIPLLGAAAGVVLGAILGRRRSAHEAEDFAALLGDDLPVGAVGLLVITPERYAGEVRSGMTRARRTTGRTLDDEHTLALARSLVRGDPVATEALSPDPPLDHDAT
jgi:uncharacterized membrane protein